jgi:hypothetical protein
MERPNPKHKLGGADGEGEKDGQVMEKEVKMAKKGTLPLRTALMLMMSACIVVYVHAHTANHSTFITMVVPHVTKMQITELHATESPRNERPSVLPLPLCLLLLP